MAMSASVLGKSASKVTSIMDHFLGAPRWSRGRRSSGSQLAHVGITGHLSGECRRRGALESVRQVAGSALWRWSYDGAEAKLTDHQRREAIGVETFEALANRATVVSCVFVAGSRPRERIKPLDADFYGEWVQDFPQNRSPVSPSVRGRVQGFP
jgi:hypothetical protein